MQIFNTYFYEVSKGTKPVALVTCEFSLTDKILSKLKRENVPFFMQKLSDFKANIFFGKKECIDVIKKFLNKPLNMLTPAEDFILGTILGYDTVLQCKRFLERSGINE